MQSIIRKFILAPVVVLGASLAANSAMAETIKVPFDFKAGGTICPAGSYILQHDDTGNFVTLKGKDSAHVFSYVVGPGRPDLSDHKIALRFDEVNHAHVLQSIQFGAVTTSRLDKSVIESERESSRLTGGR